MKTVIKIVKWTIGLAISAAILFGFVSCAKYFHDCATYENIVEYKLVEINDGVYGYYNTVSSKAPASNYEVITLCLNGSVRTLKGDVNIHYTTGDPKLVWTQTKTVNGDTIDVYVPQGSIEMRPNVGLG